MPYRTNRTRFEFGFGYGLTRAVKQLLIANAVLFVLSILAQAAGMGGFVRLLMLTPYAVTHLYAVWQPVTYLFLHGGFFHLFFNLFALWMFGGELEQTWGYRRFLHYYFLTGIGAGLTVVLLHPSSPVATLGASGAIYGLLLAYGLLFPNRTILLYFLFPIQAKYFVLIMGAIELLSDISMPGDVVNHLAHLGGMAFGFAYLRGRPLYFDLRNRYYRWRRLRLQRQFEVYRRKRDSQGRQGGPWVN